MDNSNKPLQLESEVQQFLGNSMQPGFYLVLVMTGFARVHDGYCKLGELQWTRGGASCVRCPRVHTLAAELMHCHRCWPLWSRFFLADSSGES